MLARSAARRQHHRHTTRLLAAASFAQLTLPWLAPAQLRWTATRAATIARGSNTRVDTHTSLLPRPRHETRSRAPSPLRPQLRCLATAADAHTAPSASTLSSALGGPAADDYIPFDFSSYGKPAAGPFGLGGAPDPIILSAASQTPDKILTRSGNILRASARDLLAHLHTSMSVGRWDRAASVVQRLVRECGPHSEEAMHAHSLYLHKLLLDLMLHGRDSPQTAVVLKEMQRWFEVEVRNKGVQPDSSMLVTMMRASIRGLAGSRRDRSIRRYADLSQQLGDDVLEDVLLSEDYDDNEFAVLGRATQEFYEDESVQQEETVDTPSADPSGSGQAHLRDDTIDLSTVPEVRATEQKGTGLEGIKRAMGVFTQAETLPADASAASRREQAYALQRRMEDTAVDIAVARWQKADEDLRKIGIHTSMQSKPIAGLMWQWYSKLLPLLEEELEEVKKAYIRDKGDDCLVYGPYLELLPVKKVAANTILHVMTRMAGDKNTITEQFESETKLGTLAINLSKALESEWLATVAGKGGKSASKKPHSTANLRRRAIRALEKGIEKSRPGKSKRKKEIQAALAQVEWPVSVKVKLGAMLVSKLMETAQLPVTREHPRTKEQVTQMQPAFMHRMKYYHGKRVGVFMPNPALIQKIKSEPVGSLLAKRMPMVVPPLPWTGWAKGGYLHYSNPILRLAAGDKSGKDYFMAADEKQDLSTLYKGLTALSKVPWKIHRGVFNVQLEAWNSGEEIANFAPLNPELPVPPEPDSSADPVQRLQWQQKCRDIANSRSGNHSKRCFQNFQLEIARTMLNETLYFPHNMDFRGRAYPIPPYLNHMGADNVRGLLVFGEGKELGESGLRWLKIHMATVAGYDKASMEERIEFTMQHLDDIYDSAKNPLSGRRWWLQAEDAWQTLAACFELVAALDSPDPTKYISHLPVQQDGTCNGLQHYAALGGDKAGAAQVNLEPSDRPADVYTAVAEAVKAKIAKDAQDGNPVAQKLDGRITRKCVKQPVMTNVYGVTFWGARVQVRRQLEAIFTESRHDDPVNLGLMSHYVTQKIFESLGQMFTGAQKIQDWLGQCADRVATCLTPEQVEELKDEKKMLKRAKKSRSKNTDDFEDEEAVAIARRVDRKERYAASKPLFKTTVVWTTPLRLPVVQPYRASKSKIVSTSMQDISIRDPQVWDPVSRRKQLQAFPPNFIHSLDATHMLLSALKCTENGMTFASIHDSFWTHACDVNRMSEVLRDAFVAMHSEDIIGRLREEFNTRYRGHMYLATVDADSAVGQRIEQYRMEAKTKAKKAKVESMPSELAREAERARLMQSEDAAERAQGQAMVTPASILASETDTTCFAPATQFAGATLGEMPLNPARVEDDEAIAVEAPDDEADMEEAGESADAAVEDVEPGMTASEASKTSQGPEQGNKKKTKSKKKLQVWIPLTFPEVPEKGDFDVRRLRESRYFFH